MYYKILIFKYHVNLISTLQSRVGPHTFLASLYKCDWVSLTSSKSTGLVNL